MRVLRWAGIVLAVLVAALAGWVVWVNLVSIPGAETLDREEAAPADLVEVDGRSVHLHLDGPESGEPILLVHGFGVLGGRTWEALVPELVEAGRRVIVPDLLPYGYSERIDEPGDWYTHRGQAATLAGLLDALGFDRADVMGFSYGGGVAAQLAIDRPDLVDELVIQDGQVYDLGGGFFGWLGTLPLGVGRALSYTALGASSTADRGLSLECGSGGSCPTEQTLEARRRAASVEDTTDALVAFARTGVNASIPQQLPEMPTLVIWGSEDSIIPIENGRRLVSELADARLEVIEGAGHDPHVNRASEVADLVLSFTDG